MKALKQILIWSVLMLGILPVSAQKTNVRPYVSVQFVPNHSDWNYRLDEDVVIDLSVCRSYVALPDMKVDYEWGMDTRSPELVQSVVTGADGVVRLRLKGSDVPGFKMLKATTVVDGITYSNYIKLGFEPERLEPTTQLPSDFLSFWQKSLKKAREVPLLPKMTLQPDLCTSSYDVYMIKFQNARPGTYIYGMLTVPKKEGRFAAVLKVPGAGVRAYHGERGILAEADAVTLQIGIHGIPVNMDDYIYQEMRAGCLKSYNVQQNDDRDKYYYKNVYLGCVKAIDFLAQLPMVDSERIGVYGGSQGGLLSLVVAALEPRVKCVSCSYPAMAEIAGRYHGRADGWPHLFLKPDEPGIEEKVRVSGYYDAVNFARYVKQPMLFFLGYNDMVCCPTSTYTVYNTLTCPKQLYTPLDCGHWLYPEQQDLRAHWLLKQLGAE
ncbi:MAG: acetylxylan esterase [Paludibacteraceae bacterium]|nr:acetylxylan esterase [Paludibacteraceae bacterium]